MESNNAKGFTLLHICEVCGKEERLTSAEGHMRGWIYPPRASAFGALSPRTCGVCPIEATLWHEMMICKTSVAQLSAKHLQTLFRIIQEQESILPDGDKL